MVSTQLCSNRTLSHIHGLQGILVQVSSGQQPPLEAPQQAPVQATAGTSAGASAAMPEKVSSRSVMVCSGSGMVGGSVLGGGGGGELFPSRRRRSLRPSP